MRGGNFLNATVGDYRLVDFLGAGGMGEVYRAVHTKIGRVVAIKVLPQQSRDASTRERFANEARIQAGFQHPGIAALYDYTLWEGRPCIVMECVSGQTLDEYVAAEGSLHPSEALRVFEGVAEAVGYVHRHAVVHRDIKSNNIKLTPEGQVKLLDFGIAKSGNSPNLTAAGDVVGTLNYLSPEQLRGQPAGPRTDIWALGVLLYEMITGTMPFHADTTGGLLELIRNGAYARPSSFDSSVPREVEAIIARCLKRNPAQRYATADELLEDVRRARAAEFAELAAAEKPFSPPPPARTNRRAVWASALGALALVCAGSLYLATRGGPATPTAGPDSALVVVADTGNSARTGDVKSVKVHALEGEAEVYRDDLKIGVTPFELRERLGHRVELTLKRSGYRDKRVEFFVSENKREYTISLEPADGSN